MTQLTHDSIREAVRNQYSKVATSSDSSAGCATTSCCDTLSSDAKTTSRLLGYSTKEVCEVPDGANMGLGCGNPQAIASLQMGETVLDLGSGGGFDCFLAIKAVGESGRVIGVDMTPQMITKARSNIDKTDHQNVEFRLGEIENLPVADATIDVIISNCVINLSPEKEIVFQEAFRVLKAGGRLAISDIVSTIELPEKFKHDMALFTGCMAGASSITDLEALLKSTVFEAIEIKPKDTSRAIIREWLPNSHIEDYLVSATIAAIKPKEST